MAYGCNPATAANEMLLTKRVYADFTGKEIPQKDVLLYQIRQSFKLGKITPEQVQQISYELAMSWTKGKHQFIVATHIDQLLQNPRGLYGLSESRLLQEISGRA